MPFTFILYFLTFARSEWQHMLVLNSGIVELYDHFAIIVLRGDARFFTK